MRGRSRQGFSISRAAKIQGLTLDGFSRLGQALVFWSILGSAIDETAVTAICERRPRFLHVGPTGIYAHVRTALARRNHDRTSIHENHAHRNRRRFRACSWIYSVSVARMLVELVNHQPHRLISTYSIDLHSSRLVSPPHRQPHLHCPHLHRPPITATAIYNTASTKPRASIYNT